MPKMQRLSNELEEVFQKEFRKKRVICKNIYAYEKQDGQIEIIMNARTTKGRLVTATELSRIMSKELLESEMFGHKAGSFTGALKDKKGLFEEANHGTIFLDEIGEMAFDLQAKLLRILEAGEFIKIGDTKPTKVDVRVIAATNRDLTKEIENGHFREDLYYRLSVFCIPLPPLSLSTYLFFSGQCGEIDGYRRI